MANIKVAVRIRPISDRELNLTGSELVVRADLNEISLTNLKVSSSKAGDSRERTRRYGFDYCFDSSDSEAENYADQAKIYKALGQSVLDAVFTGYNSCLVAYGQSASGKTYTMMGTKDEPGLTPRLCEGIFSRIEEEKKHERIYRVSVSYLEIYNDRVRDLLKPFTSTSGLRVREHPRLGPYVQGLTYHVVRTLGSLMSYVEEGTKARKTASTLQNPSSSRSHALLTVTVSPESSSIPVGSGHSGVSSPSSTARRSNELAPRAGSKLHLVDLAGSESAATCSGVHRLKEGANINKSLVALGNVISALVERGSTGSGPGRRFIPYRDSSLTWLLKDALGGNATTIMLATISPASGSYNETAHTLRFAHRAQSVVNRPVVNEDPVARIIRELRAEVARLKFLLQEKNIEPEIKGPCCCKKDQVITDREDLESLHSKKSENLDREVKLERGKEEKERAEKTIGSNASPIRRCNSIETVATLDADSTIKRFGSYEFLTRNERFLRHYNRAKVTELNDEEDEISEINESVFVDIPTLVAVLIKPDDNLQETSTQIEEICSYEVAEDSIDVEFIDSGNDLEVFEDPEKPYSVDERSSSVNSCRVSVDTEINDVYRNSECPPRLSEQAPKIREKGKFRKQDSVDMVTSSVASNLHTSKRFGSVETILGKKESFFPLERSQTNLEKRPVVSEKAKKLNNIREIDDQKAAGKTAGIWRGSSESTGSKEQLQRKSSNDSDKSLKESGSKSKSYARKPSLENLKRKTSKDSSSSSSKEEQILFSSLTRDKLLRRKSSIDQEPSRAHTPIQRAKRAEIVAAVTERLYSSRKPPEENAAGIRSPPEGTDVHVRPTSFFGTKSKLQEISRKMLGKRRRVCVDTQTESSRTIRMKDTASLTENPRLVCQDVGVLTDDHSACEIPGDHGVPVLRVKEIATLTDKPKTDIVRCKDVGSLANDLEDYDYEIQSPRNDSGILSDDTQNYAESNLSSAEASDLCTAENERRIVCTERSTNATLLSACRDSAVQTGLTVPRQETVNHQRAKNKTICARKCCSATQEESAPLVNAERNVISISLPDMINITIESTNVLESRIAVMDSSEPTPTEEKVKFNTREKEVQTENTVDSGNEAESRFSLKDFTRSTLSQTDGRVFRIENIFQDPNNTSRGNTSKVDVDSDFMENARIRNSVTFTNSLGTLYVPDSKQNTAEIDEDKIEGDQDRWSFWRSGSFVKDGLITEAFITKKRNCCLNPRSSEPLVYNDPWKNWMIPCPGNSMQTINYKREPEVTSSSWQLRKNEASMNLSCRNCTKYGQPRVESNLNDSNAQAEPNCSTSFTNLDGSNTSDYDYSFSDDSLDYNENNILIDSTILKQKLDDCENRDNLCPPDVVAHTKREILKSMSSAENAETQLSDFEDSHVEFPKMKPNDTSGDLPIHEYKALILGRSSCEILEGVDGPSEDAKASSRASGTIKKKVSFSKNSGSPEKREESMDQKQGSSKENSSSGLKSIIKKKKKTTLESPNIAQSSNDETDDSQQEDKRNLTSTKDRRENDWRGRIQLANSVETSREDLGSDDSRKNSKRSSNRKKVKFFAVETPENTCSESESCEYPEDEEILEDCCTRNIIEEYLDEAVTFMRNMNSINEYMSATKIFEKHLGRNRRRAGTRRRSCPSSWNQDHVEFEGRRVSSKDDTYECLQDDEEIRISMEPYDRCLKGIQRLEECIRKVDEQNELLREKFGINCESAGARLNLANPSIDPHLLSTMKSDSAIPRGKDFSLFHSFPEERLDSRTRVETGLANGDSKCSSLIEDDLDDDLEKKIFDQLMSVADATRYSYLRRPRQMRFSKLSEVRSTSPTCSFKLRERLNSKGREPTSFGEHGIFHFEESPSGDEFRDLRIETSRSRMNLTKIDDDSLDEADSRTLGDARSFDLKNTRERLQGDNVSTIRAQDADDSIRLSPKRESLSDCNLEMNDSLDGLGVQAMTNFTVHRVSSNIGDKIQEVEDYSRKIKPSGSKMCLFTQDMSDVEDSIDPNASSMDENAHFREKFKYPGSPRARFLELLRERRRIVENSRGTSAF